MDLEVDHVEEEGFKRDGFRENIFIWESYTHNRKRTHDKDEEWVCIEKYNAMESEARAAQQKLASLELDRPNRFNFAYSIGQNVFQIENDRIARYEECMSCDKGFIVLKDQTKLNCPTCKGIGLINDGYVTRWKVGRMLTIGQLRLEYDTKKLQEQYMCYETGVGSGSVYYRQMLFPTKELAQAECDKKNTGLYEWRCVDCETKKTGNHSNAYSSPRHHREWLNCIQHGNSLHYRFLDGKQDQSEKTDANSN